MKQQGRRIGSLLSAIMAAGLGACASTTTPPAPEARTFEAPVEISIGDDRLPGTMYVAEGSGPHPTVVWLHGFPGLPEPTAETIAALRGRGINVLYLHYRGAWGAPGRFSAARALEDASAAISFARSAGPAASYRIDTGAVIPVGDSFGSWVALRTAADDPGLPCAAGALVLNVGRLGAELSSSEEMRLGFSRMFSQIDDDPQLSFTLEAGADGLLNEIISASDRYDLTGTASAFEDRDVLLVGASNDDLAPVAVHLDPVAGALEAAGAHVTRQILTGGHELLDSEYAGIVADWINQECRD